MKRAFTEDYKIDGTPMLDPDAGVTITRSDLESETVRDESGFLHRSVLRHDMRTWSFAYSTLTAEEHEYILNLFSGKNTFRFDIINQAGVAESLTCYCAKKSTVFYSKRHGLYKNLKFEITEC